MVFFSRNFIPVHAKIYSRIIFLQEEFCTICRCTILSTNLTCVVPSPKEKENWVTQSIFNFVFFVLPEFWFVDVVYASLELKQFFRLGCYMKQSLFPLYFRNTTLPMHMCLNYFHNSNAQFLPNSYRICYLFYKSLCSQGRA